MDRLRKRDKAMTFLGFLKEHLPLIPRYLGAVLYLIREREEVINYGRWVVDVKYDDVTIRYGFKKFTVTSNRFPYGRVSDLFITKEKNKVHTELHQVRKGYISEESAELTAKLLTSIDSLKCGSRNKDDLTNAEYLAEAILRDRPHYGNGWIQLSQRKNYK